MNAPRFSNVRLSTGPSLHYAQFGDDAGEPVVFLHGWPDSWFSFSRVVSQLPPRFRALLPDQRGFGDSERPEGVYRIEVFADDVVALLDALSIRRATLVGHSFGSFVTRCAALAHPDRVSRIVLIGTAASANNAVTRQVQSEMRTLEDPVPLEFVRDFQASTVHVPLPASFFDRLVAESLKVPARLWRAVFDAVLSYDDADALQRLTTPALLLWGERDALFPRSDQERLASKLPDARLTIYQETGHCPNWERPELVAADLLDFFRTA